MKLISVKILGTNFRSLTANKLYEFTANPRKDRLSPKIFAGLNGSGKSNFLELLAEIFFYLEKYHMYSVTSSEKKGTNIGFEIEYLLPIDEETIYLLFEDEIEQNRKSFIDANSSRMNLKRVEFESRYAIEIDESINRNKITLIEELSIEGNSRVRIIKAIDNSAKFYIKRTNSETYKETLSNTSKILPKKVIAYTSGQNEILSNPFLKIRYHYFKERQKLESNNKKKSLFDDFENQRLFFLDISSNYSIFVANMLLASAEKLKYLKRLSKQNTKSTEYTVYDLNSFRITLNLVDYRKNKINFSDNIVDKIDKLKSCATSWIHKKEGKEETIILDYKVTEATRESFRFHFKNSLELFKTFYSLENLNLYLVNPDTRSLIVRYHKSLNLSDELPNLSDELPKPDPSRLIFRIEKILLDKIENRMKPAEKIYYKALSDGEHQLNEVVGSVLMMEQDGCLFLMDEPDTHFNPVWRAKMVEMLNMVSATAIDSKGKVESVRQQEIIITTHSPFVISDSMREDVYKFDKINGEVTYINPKIETYGASVSLLLQEIFNRKITISDLANLDLEELRDALKHIESPEAKRTKIEEIKNKLLDFGESIEKFDLYSLLRQLEKELDLNK